MKMKAFQSLRSCIQRRPDSDPGFYSAPIDKIRADEYPSMQNVTYLDHGGATVPAKSVVNRFARDLSGSLFANPHSDSPSSRLSTDRVEGVRNRLLSFFKASPDDYDLVFVPNATGAIKLMAEAFQSQHFQYAYHVDSHTSIVGVSQLAKDARVFSTPSDLDEWFNTTSVQDDRQDDRSSDTAVEGESNLKLLAFPAQSNMNGCRFPYHDWIKQIKSKANSRVYTLLDAAAYVVTAQLDLSDPESSPDMVAVSLHKIFGFPDIGALLVRKDDSLEKIFANRRYFGGGTVNMIVTVGSFWVARRTGAVHDYLEDGTLPFHNILALDHAMDVHSELFGSMRKITQHTSALTARLANGLSSLQHSNGRPVCHLYSGPGSKYGDSNSQGPTVCMNLKDIQGRWIGKTEVDRRAIRYGIHLRTGGLCNPGGIQIGCSVQDWEMKRNYDEGVRCGNDIDVLYGKPTGVVRVSLGAMSNRKDVDRFLYFVQKEFLNSDIGVGLDSEKRLKSSEKVFVASIDA